MPNRIRFYLDEHVPAPVTEGLKRRGVDILTTQVAGNCGVLDPEQLAFARTQGRVLVTSDTDFLVLASSGIDHAGIVFCAATKYTVGQALHALLLVHDVLAPEAMRNHVEFL
ncbi:MAG: DUF5615 family PIN-like protein [Planctomycetes bacterium]|nr:DUF5615 family PIN-like protein [Planctomycetota bacterium]